MAGILSYEEGSISCFNIPACQVPYYTILRFLVHDSDFVSFIYMPFSLSFSIFPAMFRSGAKWQKRPWWCDENAGSTTKTSYDSQLSIWSHEGTDIGQISTCCHEGTDIGQISTCCRKFTVMILKIVHLLSILYDFSYFGKLFIFFASKIWILS